MTEKSARMRLATRLVLLFALLTTLAYLKNPTRSYATTCQQNCLTWEHECVQSCGSNSECSNECILEYKSCVDGCPR
jgi:hypothetical protein